jgi:hypothetical protein
MGDVSIVMGKYSEARTLLEESLMLYTFWNVDGNACGEYAFRFGCFARSLQKPKISADCVRCGL